MKREYHRWFSPTLGREMELLVFGHDGLPAVVFPTSQGRFYEFEDRGMVEAVAEKLEGGRLQLFCVDSVDSESFYNRGVGPDWQIARQVQYENYVLREVLPFVRSQNRRPHLAAMGCSFGGYHAVNIAFRHPHLFTACLSMSGAFDLRGLGFLRGFHNDDTRTCSPPGCMTSAGVTTNGWLQCCGPREFRCIWMCGGIMRGMTGHGGSGWRRCTCRGK
jgi:esterase/lipase superfamily enzyme